jgi:hypothetical protein
MNKPSHQCAGKQGLCHDHGEPHITLITDGCVLTHESHRYRIRLAPATPDPKWGAMVAVEVEALADDGASLAYFDDTVTTDEPESIEDAAFTLIFDLAAKCWPEHERLERERAEVRLQREINRLGFDGDDFDCRR